MDVNRVVVCLQKLCMVALNVCSVSVTDGFLLRIFTEALLSV